MFGLIITVLAIIVLFLFLIKLYSIFTKGKCTSQTKLYGKTAIVTGSNRGIGYYTALDLAKRGARVIITSENAEDLPRARNQIIAESGNANVIAKHLDLRSFKGIRAFVADVLSSEARLDILVNNAGVAGLKRQVTEDGLLAGLQINYFGPFLLTMLLLNLLKKSGPSRIVNVCSLMAQNFYHFDVNDISDHSCEGNDWSDLATYSNSKLCVFYATMEMAARLKDAGVTVNCLHPGAVRTQIFDFQNNLVFIIWLSVILFGKNVEEGAQTSIYLAVSDSVKKITGKYFSDCRQSNIWVNKSPEVLKSVWDQSVKLTKLSPDEIII